MSWFLMNRKGEQEKKRKDEIRKQFMKAIGKNETDGKLSKDQWINVMTAAGINISQDEIQKTFDNKDKDLDGRLSFEEFMGEETKAEKLFKLMDKDGDGYVTKAEFREVCRNLNKEQIDLTFKKFDQTGNDKLNAREFCDMMNKRSNSSSKLQSPGSKTSTGSQPNSQKTSTVSNPGTDKSLSQPIKQKSVVSSSGSVRKSDNNCFENNHEDATSVTTVDEGIITDRMSNATIS